MGEWYIAYGDMIQFYMIKPSTSTPTSICVFASNEDEAMEKSKPLVGTGTFVPRVVKKLDKSRRYAVRVIY